LSKKNNTLQTLIFPYKLQQQSNQYSTRTFARVPAFSLLRLKASDEGRRRY